MLRNLLLVSTALVAVVMPTHASAAPLIGAAVATLGSAFAAGTLAGTLLTTAITVGISVGASYLIQALQGKPSAPRPADVSSIIKQDVPTRWKHYGRRRVGGALLFAETMLGNLHMILAHGQGIADDYEKAFLDDRVVTIGGGGWVTSAPYPANVVQIVTRPGTDDQTAFGEVISAFPDIWTSDHRVRGQALSHLRAGAVPQEVLRDVYPQTVPTLAWIARFGRPLDPRTGTHAWTRNLALQLADYLTSDDGRQIPWSYIDIPRLNAAADICDQAVPIKGGGTIPRYHGGLSYQLTDDPSAVVRRFLTAMDGRLTVLENGKVAIDAGAWVAPTVTILDEDISDCNLRAGNDADAEANEVLVKFTHAEADYAEAQADPWRDEDDISAFGQVKSLSLELYEVEHHNHARRLAKLAARRAMPEWKGSLTTNRAGLEAWDQRFVRIQVAALGIDTTFEILSMAFDMEEGRVTLDVISFDATAYAFNAATEEGTGPVVPAKVDPINLSAPEGVEAFTSSRLVGDGVNVPVVGLAWAAPTRIGMKAQAQYAPHGTDQWTEMAVSNDANQAEAVGVSTGVAYDMRVRYRGPGGSVSNWVVVEDISAVADPTPPAIVTNVNATSTDPGEVVISWRTPNSANYRGARIYQNTVNTFGTADLVETVYGAPSSNGSALIDGLSPDSYYFWVVAINGGGTEATPTSAGLVGVD